MVILTLGEVAEYINGRAFKPTEWEETGKPIIRIQNLTNSSETCNRTNGVFEERYLVHDGDLLFAWSASLGAHIWNGEDGWLNQHIFKVVPNNKIEKMFLYYYLIYIVDQLYAKTHGSGMVHITLKPFKATQILVPNKDNQIKIIKCIEHLFSQLDEAKEKVQSVLDGFEQRKAAILHQAFSGELTRRWRKEQGLAMKEWISYQLLDILIDKPRNGYSPKPVDFQTPYKSMTLSATTSGVFKPEFFKYINERIGEDSYLWLVPRDILIQRANSLDKVGTSALYTGKEHEFIYPDLMMKLQVKKEYSAEFIAYQLKTEPVMSYLRANATGTAGNMPKVNQKTVSAIPLIIPSLKEQEIIVILLNDFFIKEQQAKETAETVIEQIDVMKKSILARAFRGELGTNDPMDESAEVLLKTVLHVG